MSHHLTTLRALFARLSKIFRTRAHVAMPADARAFQDACKELAFWSASDAGLDGRIDAFDGSTLHPAADGMCTLRLTLQDTTENRSAADAAALVLRAFDGLRVLVLLEVDGVRFVHTAPNVNLGIRELGRSFSNRSERTG